MAELLHREGPLISVLLVGAPHARWRTEIAIRPTRSGNESCAALRQTLGIDANAPDIHGADGAAHILGMAVFEAWRVVSDAASSMDTFHLMAVTCASSPKAHTPHFLEHMARATAVLVGHPVEFPGFAGAGG